MNEYEERAFLAVTLNRDPPWLPGYVYMHASYIEECALCGNWQNRLLFVPKERWFKPPRTKAMYVYCYGCDTLECF